MISIEKLIEQKEDLQKSLEEARKTSIEMDSKMQSRYDTQKEDWAARANLIEHLIEETQKQIDYLVNLSAPAQNDFVEIGHVVTVRVQDDTYKILIIDGAGGGIKLEDVQLVSIGSPIGRALLGHRKGDIVRMPSQEGVILIILAIDGIN